MDMATRLVFSLYILGYLVKSQVSVQDLQDGWNSDLYEIKAAGLGGNGMEAICHIIQLELWCMNSKHLS